MSLSTHTMRFLTTLLMILRQTPEWVQHIRPHVISLRTASKDVKQMMTSCKVGGDHVDAPPSPTNIELGEIIVHKKEA